MGKTCDISWPNDGGGFALPALPWGAAIASLGLWDWCFVGDGPYNG